MLLSRTIEGFILDSQIANKTPKTVKNIACQLRYFLEWHGDAEITAITPDDLKQYLRAKQLSGDQPQTLYTRYKWIKAFFHYCVREGHLTEAPTRAIPTPRLPQALPKVLTPEQVEVLMRRAKADTSAQGHRNFAMLATMLDTGLRSMEVAALSLEDVYVNGSYLLVRMGKGQKGRPVPISPILRKVLWRYVYDYRPKLHATGDSLFPNQEGEAMTPSGVQQMVRKRLRKIGISGGSHLLRHTFATMYLRHGGDLERLRIILGHTTLDVTQRYIHLAQEDLIRSHEKTTPLAHISL